MQLTEERAIISGMLRTMVPEAIGSFCAIVSSEEFWTISGLLLDSLCGFIGDSEGFGAAESKIIGLKVDSFWTVGSLEAESD